MSQLRFRLGHICRDLFLLLAFVLSIPAFAQTNFEFVVIGDTRPRFQSDSFKPFQSLITKINELKPALVINLGDLIYGYGMPSKEKQWDRYIAIAKTIEVPYYQVPGNHDTHSRSARRVYQRRFGNFYSSFDYGDCHFVLLDTTEDQQWGKIGPAQLAWLKHDLSETKAKSVFVFTHFPIWEPERIIPKYYDFWLSTLHPLFRASRVKAVFAGHYHSYGPTREYDGIRYFITGGGGAELRPEYRKSGGEFHFMRVKMSGAAWDVRVVGERGEMTDSEADVMGGLQFAARHVTRIGIVPGDQDLKAGVPLDVSVSNPYPFTMRGEARWIIDSAMFSVEPATFDVEIPSGRVQQFSFNFKALQDQITLSSLPRLQFTVTAGGRTHRFHRDLRVLQKAETPYDNHPPLLNGDFSDWTRVPTLQLGGNPQPTASFMSRWDDSNLYLALRLPSADMEEVKEIGFSDELQIGLARRISKNDFGNDFLRLGFNYGSRNAFDRTPTSRKTQTPVPGVKVASRKEGSDRFYEIAVPLRLLERRRSLPSGLVLDVSFPVPDAQAETNEPQDPAVNSLSYRIRYGSDSLVPVYFLELHLSRKK